MVAYTVHAIEIGNSGGFYCTFTLYWATQTPSPHTTHHTRNTTPSLWCGDRHCTCKTSSVQMLFCNAHIYEGCVHICASCCNVGMSRPNTKGMLNMSTWYWVGMQCSQKPVTCYWATCPRTCLHRQSASEECHNVRKVVVCLQFSIHVRVPLHKTCNTCILLSYGFGG